MKSDKPKNTKTFPDNDLINDFDYLANAASSHDMTGLIPAAPASKEELESYEDLMHFLPPTGNLKKINP